MKYILAVLFAELYGACDAQNRIVFSQNIDSTIYEYITDHNLPSLSVGVVYKDTVLYGKRIVNTENHNPIDNIEENSIYNVASLAKPMVATAIMILVQRGEIDLKTPVAEYLPYFTIDSKYKNDITVEHLLMHTSGLPSVSSPGDYDYVLTDTSDYALENHIKSLYSIKLKFKPGKKYSYSNVGFEILGEVIAKVSGMSFDNYMHSNLFQPLNMNRTSYILSDFTKSEITQAYTDHPYRPTNQFPYNRAFSPSGNLFTSIEDMNNWMIFNLNNGIYMDFKPLSSQNYSLLTTPRVDTKEDGYIGLSWFTKKNQGGTIIFHDGMDLGYSALMVLFKDSKIGILVLSNHQDTNCNEILNIIARAIEF